MKYLIFVFCMVALAGFVYADHPQYYNQGGGAYEQGYVEGYQHGALDGQARLDFNFRHAHDYGNAAGDHNNYDTHQSCDFRVGYVEGYADGYFRKPALVGGHGSYGYGHGNDYHNDYDNDNGYPNSGGYTGGGEVTVFTERGFAGRAQSFGVGQYRYLSGGLNDNIDSIQVNGNVRVILFDLSDFRGERVVLDRNAYDLGHFRNKAASMIIEPIGYGEVR